MPNVNPINCQADQEAYFTYDPSTFWTNCGYRYELPSIQMPSIDAPLVPVPEPATWLLFVVWIFLVWAWRTR